MLKKRRQRISAVLIRRIISRKKKVYALVTRVKFAGVYKVSNYPNYVRLIRTREFQRAANLSHRLFPLMSGAFKAEKKAFCSIFLFMPGGINVAYQKGTRSSVAIPNDATLCTAN